VSNTIDPWPNRTRLSLVREFFSDGRRQGSEDEQ
jgi:hypothetical protein